jgi:flagellar hook-associated protein 1 FlgK
MSIFGTFTIGKQALVSHQRAVQVTSQNIANVNTEGYSRQRPVFESISPTPLPSGYPLGGGVALTRVERLADEFLDSQVRREGQELAYDAALGKGLSRLEAIFSELDGNGIDAAVTRLFSSFQDLADHPDDPTVRTAAVQAGASLTALLNDADRRLTQIAADENGKVEQLVTEVNQLASEIAEVNNRIFLLEAEEQSAASLRDRRGQLLEQLAEKIDFTSFERDDGTVSVFVGGGFFLVDAEASAELSVRTGTGPAGAFFDVYHDVDGSLAGPITNRISGGELGAVLDLRDDRVPFYRAQLDAFAYTLYDRVNDVHLAGRGLVDDQARRFFVDASGAQTTAGADFAAIPGAAGLIAVHQDLLADAGHLAAGTPSAGAALAGDNRNALELVAVETAAGPVYQITGAVPDVAAGAPSGPTRTLGDAYGALLGGLGAEIQASARREQQAELMRAELLERRGELSGVSLDEEVANLIRFEKGYQAAARIIATIDEMMEDLLAI